MKHIIKLTAINLAIIFIVGLALERLGQHYLRLNFPAGYDYAKQAKVGDSVSSAEYNIYRSAVPIYHCAWIVSTCIVSQTFFIVIVLVKNTDK